MKTTAEYITQIRQYKDANAERLGIKRIGIFGSVSRGEQKENSDLDVFVELRNPQYYIMCEIKDNLEAICQCTVDLVRLRSSLRPLLLKRIEEDGITA